MVVLIERVSVLSVGGNIDSNPSVRGRENNTTAPIFSTTHVKGAVLVVANIDIIVGSFGTETLSAIDWNWLYCLSFRWLENLGDREQKRSSADQSQLDFFGAV